ncbi:MAG: undecaprenyl diphosphate synthase family protein [Candidatus Nanohaloarchaea archaeon]
MHLGVIPDGNRRYADNHDISNEEAYRQAKGVIKDIGDDLRDNDEITEVTFYLLSEENLQRDDQELETLLKLLEEYIEDVSSSYSDNGFVLNWASTNPEALPEHMREKIRGLEEKFDSGDRRLNMLISYSGRNDILRASKKISEDDEEFSRENMLDRLEVGSQMDFVIRTGDNPTRECLSDFSIWNSSYAEFYHIKKNFPAVETSDVKNALDHYSSLRRKRGQ